MRRRQTLILAAGGLAAGVLGAAVAWWRLQPQPPADAAVAALFASTFPDADGQPQPLAQWQSKLLVVNFWATWCAPCVEEMPDLERVRRAYLGRNVEIVGLGIDNAAKIRAFRDELKLTLPLLVAGAGGSELGRLLGNTVGALPYTVLVDPAGRVGQRKLGQIKPAELQQWLDARLAS
jgi:thiol-disulfide isomerase/thioredoxin